MATAKTETLLPLDDFAHLMTIHPMHFNQVFVDNINACGVVWLQYGWQSDNCASREEVAVAIRSAEDDLERYLGFPVAPKWFEDQIVTVENYSHMRVTLPKAYYITGGKRSISLIQAGAVLNYSIPDLEHNYSDLATITVATTVNPDEIAIVYPDEAFVDWRIQGIKIIKSGGNVIITVKRHKLVKKEFLEEYTPNSITGTEDDKFLTNVDVYRVFNDPATQASFQGSSHCCGCSACYGCNNCGFSVDPGCIQGLNHKAGIVDVTPASWNGEDFTSISLQARPYLIRTHFKAGWPLLHGEMDPNWAMAVCRLALTRLNNPLCPCPNVQQKMEWWTEDLGTNSAQRGSHRIPKVLENCPWGYTRGALYAYSVARNLKEPQGR